MKLLIIAIGGFTGSGKNTVGEFLAKELNFNLVCPTMKDLAKKEGISLIEFQKRAEKDHNIDIKFDQLLKDEASKGNCVVTTWLGPWMLQADLRIFLNAPPIVRAERIMPRDNLTLEQALKHIKERDAQNKRRYKKIYKIDIEDNSIFDLVINSQKLNKDQVNRIVLHFSKMMIKR